MPFTILGRGDLVGPAGMAITKQVGDLGKAGADAAGSYFAADAEIQKAKQQARAQIETTRIQGATQKYTMSVDEASEIFSVFDRPFIRGDVRLSDDILIHFDASILSIFGALVAHDHYVQYGAIHRRLPGRITDAQQLTNIFQGMLGNMPLLPESVALRTSFAAPTTESPDAPRATIVQGVNSIRGDIAQALLNKMVGIE